MFKRCVSVLTILMTLAVFGGSAASATTAEQDIVEPQAYKATTFDNNDWPAQGLVGSGGMAFSYLSVEGTNSNYVAFDNTSSVTTTALYGGTNWKNDVELSITSGGLYSDEGTTAFFKDAAAGDKYRITFSVASIQANTTAAAEDLYVTPSLIKKTEQGFTKDATAAKFTFAGGSQPFDTLSNALKSEDFKFETFSYEVTLDDPESIVGIDLKFGWPNNYKNRSWLMNDFSVDQLVLKSNVDTTYAPRTMSDWGKHYWYTHPDNIPGLQGTYGDAEDPTITVSPLYYRDTYVNTYNCDAWGGSALVIQKGVAANTPVTGIVIRALPEFTQADIGKTYDLSFKLQPANFKEDATEDERNVQVEISAYEDIDSRDGTPMNRWNEKSITLQGQAGSSLSFATAPEDIHYSFTVTEETLGVTGFYIKVDLTALNIATEAGKFETNLNDDLYKMILDDVSVAAYKPAEELKIEKSADGYKLVNPENTEFGDAPAVLVGDYDANSVLTGVYTNAVIDGEAFANADDIKAGHTLRAFVFDDYSTLKPLLKNSVTYTAE